MAENVEVEGNTVLSKVQSISTAQGLGNRWDVRTMIYCNLYDMGIIDPAKVTNTTIENLASVLS